jgi:hypothetical protein
MLERLSKRSSSSTGAPPSDSSAASLVEAFLSCFTGVKLAVVVVVDPALQDDAKRPREDAFCITQRLRPKMGAVFAYLVGGYFYNVSHPF